YPFLKEVDSCLIRNSIFNLEDSFKRFFNKLGGYPKFKKKDTHDSYKTNNIKSTYKGKTYNSIRIDLKNKTIFLPKLKEVKIRGYRNKESIIGTIKSATIKREADKYYVSVLVDEEIIKPVFNPKSIIGIDLGIKDLIITSHNEKIENSLEVKTLNKKVKGLQKALSRSKSGSKNRYKIKLKIRRVYQKIKNKRKFLLHDITNKLVKNNDIIVTEDLDIKSMKENHYIAKRLTNIPLKEIINMLKYKCERLNKKLFQINRYYASSQICSRCGYLNNNLKDLSIRKWKCEKCGIIHDRDINASLNIMFEGLKIYMKGIEQIA
ncbi:MAG: transposase, partial [Bacilli bacterium]|nr:transposase [Bacilli bacterium]